MILLKTKVGLSENSISGLAQALNFALLKSGKTKF
jgi:hypothetical protein